jgi:hypothetical protein
MTMPTSMRDHIEASAADLPTDATAARTATRAAARTAFRAARGGTTCAERRYTTGAG